MTTVALLLAKEIYCMNFFISTFVSNARLKFAKNQAKAHTKDVQKTTTPV